MDLQRILNSLRNVVSGIPSHGNVSLTSLDTVDLETVLLDQPDLKIFDNKMCFYGSVWASVKIRDLALWLIWRAEGVGPETAVANLSKYVTDTKIPFRQIMVLGGVRVTAPVKLNKGIEVVSFESLRALYYKEDVAQSYKKFHTNNQPSAALQQTVLYPHDHRDRDADLWFPPDLYQDLEDARLCITAIGPSGPVMLGAWTEPEEWVPDVGGASGAIPNAFNVGGYPIKVAEDLRELPEIHSRWVALKEKERQHLRVPLSRINTALRREQMIDSAIDLGIAIDALFLAEREANRGELAFTLRLRAARYLGHDETTRREIAKVFSALYSMRSAAVHSGILPESIDGFKIYPLLHLGYDLTGQVIRRIIRDGEPDWHKVILA